MANNRTIGDLLTAQIIVPHEVEFRTTREIKPGTYTLVQILEIFRNYCLPRKTMAAIEKLLDERSTLVAGISFVEKQSWEDVLAEICKVFDGQAEEVARTLKRLKDPKNVAASIETNMKTVGQDGPQEYMRWLQHYADGAKKLAADLEVWQRLGQAFSDVGRGMGVDVSGRRRG